MSWWNFLSKVDVPMNKETTKPQIIHIVYDTNIWYKKKKKEKKSKKVQFNLNESYAIIKNEF